MIGGVKGGGLDKKRSGEIEKVKGENVERIKKMKTRATISLLDQNRSAKKVKKKS